MPLAEELFEGERMIFFKVVSPGTSSIIHQRGPHLGVYEQHSWNSWVIKSREVVKLGVGEGVVDLKGVGVCVAKMHCMHVGNSFKINNIFKSIIIIIKIQLVHNMCFLWSEKSHSHPPTYTLSLFKR